MRSSFHFIQTYQQSCNYLHTFSSVSIKIDLEFRTVGTRLEFRLHVAHTVHIKYRDSAKAVPRHYYLKRRLWFSPTCIYEQSSEVNSTRKYYSQARPTYQRLSEFVLTSSCVVQIIQGVENLIRMVLIISNLRHSCMCY